MRKEFFNIFLCPVAKLSNTRTKATSSLLSRASTKFEPMNPAPPVTKMDFGAEFDFLEEVWLVSELSIC